MKDKIEKIKFIIERLDNYIEGTNSKANLILACNAVIIGGLLTGFAFGTKSSMVCVQKWFLTITMIAGLISCIFTILAILPFTKSIGTKNYKSLFFFKDIVSYKKQDYINFLNSQTESSELTDLSIQAYNISEGLNKKFKMMKIGILFLLIEIISISLYILNIILQ